MQKTKRMTPTEDTEQIQLFTWALWASGKYPELNLMFHVPNGGNRGKAEAGRFKAMGVKAGTPDIFLPCARSGWHGLFIEMKRQEGGRLSDKQKEVIPQLRAAGYAVAVCNGFDAARKTIILYLNGVYDSE